VIPERIEIERGWEGGGMRGRERERERMSGEDYGPQLRCAQLRGWPRCHALT